MTKGFVSCVIAALVAGGVARVGAAQAPEKAAEASATTWLAVVDGGKYGESWDEAAALFKQAMTRSGWEAALEKVRRPLGRVVTRKLRGAKFMTEVPGAPAGEYVVLVFDTSFEHAAAATETVTPMKDKGGAWRVSGYYIR